MNSKSSRFISWTARTTNLPYAAFLKRAAEACKGELTMRITNNKKPILIEACSFTAVIMPMMVDGSKNSFPEDEANAISLPEMAMV